MSQDIEANTGSSTDTRANDPVVASARQIPTCGTCGSTDVRRDAWARWDAETRSWTLGELFDHAQCSDCERDTRIAWLDKAPDHTTRIRMLNDAFRINGIGNGKLMITSGVHDMADQFPAMAVKAIRAFTAFDGDNDPHGEHDFGAFDLEGEKLFFKFDYYAPGLEHGSEDPAIGSKTVRVLTIMLAREY
jgi:hypothetical protein